MLLVPYYSGRIEALCDAVGHTAGEFIWGLGESKEGIVMDEYPKDLLG